MDEKPRKGARKIVVRDETWWWKAGSGTVEVWNPDGKRSIVDKTKISTETQRSYWRDWEYVVVTPSDMRRYIEDELVWESQS